MAVPPGGIVEEGLVPAAGHIIDDPADGRPEFGIEGPAPLPDPLEMPFKFRVVRPDDPHASPLSSAITPEPVRMSAPRADSFFSIC